LIPGRPPQLIGGPLDGHEIIDVPWIATEKVDIVIGCTRDGREHVYERDSHAGDVDFEYTGIEQRGPRAPGGPRR
jgi:hypothetical protein